MCVFSIVCGGYPPIDDTMLSRYVLVCNPKLQPCNQQIGGVDNTLSPPYTIRMSNTHTQSLTALLPTVRNLEEARKHSHEYASVITAGPELDEVRFNHPDHLVVSFDDVVDDSWGSIPPQFEQVREMISWGHGRENLLVHCHAGISRSTATAWGVAISNGWDAEEAYTALRGKHPSSSYAGMQYARMFDPNTLIISHLEKLFGYQKDELLKIHEHSHKVDRWRPARKL